MVADEHWMLGPHRLSFIPEDTLEMKAVPAAHVIELVGKAWPGEAVFISRKPINHEAQLIHKETCEVIASWGSNREAFIQLWEDAREGRPLLHSESLRVAQFGDYRKAQLALLEDKINHILAEGREWLLEGEMFQLTQSGVELKMVIKEDEAPVPSS